MRGRKARRLTLAPADLPILHGVAHSRHLAWFQVQHARIVLAVACGRTHRRPWPPEWNVTRPPSGASAAATSRAAESTSCWMTPTWGARRRFPPSSAPRSSNWLAWSRSPKGLHITHWTSQDLARQAVADGIVDAISPRTVRRILHDVDSAAASHALLEDRHGSTPSSRSGPRKSFGATAMPSVWLARASGPWPSMRCPTSRCWSGTRSGGHLRAPSSNRSSSTPGTAPSTCCCSWWSTRAGWKWWWRPRRTPSTTSGS